MEGDRVKFDKIDGHGFPDDLKLAVDPSAMCGVSLPKVLSRLQINHDFNVDFHNRKKPNRWRRMWYWILLGWKWEDV